MKAIQTRYNGHRFRSRTEARWAVFFDYLDVPYEYEPEGYVLDDGTRYLPDFYLPREDCFFEIKGAEPSEDDITKAGLLSYASGKWVDMLVGQPGRHELWAFRGKRRPPPDLLAWLELAPDEWSRKKTAESLRQLYAIPSQYGFQSRFEADPRWSILGGKDETGWKGDRLELDVDDLTGRLMVWRAALGVRPGAIHVDGRFGLHAMQSEIETFITGHVLNVAWPEQPARVHSLPEEITPSPVFYQAIEAAKSARFEFGENGSG